MGISAIGANPQTGSIQNTSSVFLTTEVNEAVTGGRPVKLVFTPAELGINPRKAPKTVRLTDEQIERKLFEKFGLNMDEAKKRLDGSNPFERVSTTGDNVFEYNSSTGRYESTFNVENSLYQKLAGTAARLKQTPPTSPNETDAARRGIDNTPTRRDDLRKLAEQAEVLVSKIGIPTDPNELKSFSVNTGGIDSSNPEDRALLALIKDNFGGGNLDMYNFREILSLAKDSGVKVQNLRENGDTARFDLSVADSLRVKIARIAVQEKANRIEKAGRDALDNNEVSSFIRGVVKGAFNAAAGTVGLITDLPGTMKTLWQVVSHPVDTFNALYQELGETWEEFKQADSSRKSEMIGELVGSAVVEILLGKGIGKAAGILAKTKTGAQILEKTNALRSATAVKIAGAFSDEAAEAASASARRKLATQLYGGIPADVMKDLTIVAGNKFKNGAIRFADFAKQMVDEFGDKIKPELSKLYTETMEKFGHRINRNEIQGLDLNTVKPNPNSIVDPPRATRRKDLAGKTHEKSGVEYDRNGYPIFDSSFDAVLPRNLIGPAIQDTAQMTEATKQLRRAIDKNPLIARRFTEGQLADIMAGKARIRDYTWHHHQDGVRLQLVDRETHKLSGHDGGRKNTGGRNE